MGIGTEVRLSLPGSEWSDVDQDRINAAMELADFASVHGLRALRREFGDDRFANVVARRDEGNYSLLDTTTDLRLKSFAVPLEADLQFRAMNLIHRKLQEHEVGVSAVRYHAMSQLGQYPVAVIDQVPGMDLRSMYPTLEEWTEKTAEVMERLDLAMGKCARRILVNDVSRMTNRGGNILLDETGRYHLIDQPFVKRGGPQLLKRAALTFLGCPLKQ